MASKRTPPTSYHHYVPQFYLRGFLNGEKLSLYSTKHQTIMKDQAIRKICGEENFFEIDGAEDFLKDQKIRNVRYKNLLISNDMLEKDLSSLETNVSKVLRKIRDEGSLEIISDTEFTFLVEWIAWLYVANPRVKKHLSERDPEGFNSTKCDGFISLHEKLLPFFMQRTWSLGRTEGSFLTSDQPVATVPYISYIRNYDAFSKATVLFPINRQLILFSNPNSDRESWFVKKTLLLKDDFQSNFAIHKNANQYLIGQSKNHINKYLEEKYKKYLIVHMIMILNRVKVQLFITLKQLYNKKVEENSKQSIDK